ncbi:MAG: hypothetical protein IT292_11115 [Deltaproteobacteria bacterium]|nr:hypothetical protein [Deltaproteobacteria bacterium]
MYINPIEKPRVVNDKRITNNSRTHKETIKETEDLLIIDSVELTKDNTRQNESENYEKHPNKKGANALLNVAA